MDYNMKKYIICILLLCGCYQIQYSDNITTLGTVVSKLYTPSHDDYVFGPVFDFQSGEFTNELHWEHTPERFDIIVEYSTDLGKYQVTLHKVDLYDLPIGAKINVVYRIGSKIKENKVISKYIDFIEVQRLPELQMLGE